TPTLDKRDRVIELVQVDETAVVDSCPLLQRWVCVLSPRKDFNSPAEPVRGIERGNESSALTPAGSVSRRQNENASGQADEGLVHPDLQRLVVRLLGPCQMAALPQDDLADPAEVADGTRWDIRVRDGQDRAH